MIEIKSSSQYHFIFIFTMLSFVVLMCMLPHIVMICLCSAMILFTVWYWMTLSRKLQFDAKGCTVHLLWFSRFYPWQKLNYQIFDNGNRYGYKIPYKKAIAFSPGKIKVPIWMQPAQYDLFAGLFSFFYVHVTDGSDNKPIFGVPAIYEADPSFEQKVIQWKNAAGEVTPYNNRL